MKFPQSSPPLYPCFLCDECRATSREVIINGKLSPVRVYSCPKLRELQETADRDGISPEGVALDCLRTVVFVD